MASSSPGAATPSKEGSSLRSVDPERLRALLLGEGTAGGLRRSAWESGSCTRKSSPVQEGERSGSRVPRRDGRLPEAEKGDVRWLTRGPAESLNSN
jgi:hypothetical protein